MQKLDGAQKFEDFLKGIGFQPDSARGYTKICDTNPTSIDVHFNGGQFIPFTQAGESGLLFEMRVVYSVRQYDDGVGSATTDDLKFFVPYHRIQPK